MTSAGWEKASVDPSAGVRLVPQLLLCPRCGGVKGRKGYDRPGLCVDCRDVLTDAEKRESRKVAKHHVPSGQRVFGKWPRQGVTFDVRRGSFVIPADLFEDGREYDLARHFARSIPDEATPGRRERLAGGVIRVHWRIVHVVAA